LPPGAIRAIRPDRREFEVPTRLVGENVLGELRVECGQFLGEDANAFAGGAGEASPATHKVEVHTLQHSPLDRRQTSRVDGGVQRVDASEDPGVERNIGAVGGQFWRHGPLHDLQRR
jgi:hypothetical protein